MITNKKPLLYLCEESFFIVEKKFFIFARKIFFIVARKNFFIKAFMYSENFFLFARKKFLWKHPSSVHVFVKKNLQENIFYKSVPEQSMRIKKKFL